MKQIRGIPIKIKRIPHIANGSCVVAPGLKLVRGCIITKAKA